MVIFIHLFSIAFVLPAFLLAYATHAFSRTMQQRDFLAGLLYALDRFCLALSWHLFALLLAIAGLATLGFLENCRWVGSMLISLTGIGSLGYIWVRCRIPDQLGQIVLFLPSWIGTVAAGWLTVVDPHAPWASLLNSSHS